jgi:PAS domain S-box-containing protein
MIRPYSYGQAKETISAICQAAAEGEFDTREKFLAVLERNPHIAAQGYNTHGKIFFWNDASAHLYGHSEAAAVNQDVFELILPPELRTFARDMVHVASKTGHMPAPSACDLVRYDGESVTVFSGHLIFRWEGTYPEFYCIDLPIDAEL